MKKSFTPLWALLLCLLTVAPARCTTVAGWGSDQRGQLGDGITVAGSVPVAVDKSGVLNGKTIVAISAGGGHALALTSEGRVYAWGENERGQLGTGTTTDSNAPVAVDTSGVLNGKTITAISAGTEFSLVLDSAGRMYAWGQGHAGELGGAYPSSLVPAAVDHMYSLNGKTIVAISAGASHCLAIDKEGKVYSWGENYAGELGDGTDRPCRIPPAPVDMSGVLSGKFVTSVSAGYHRSLALDADGHVYAWGNVGKEPNGSRSWSNVPLAIDESGILSGKTISKISAGFDGDLVLDSNGRVYAWGLNDRGQMGNGTTDSQFNAPYNAPVAVDVSGALAGKTLTAISAGVGFNMALDSDGRVYSWGSNENGRLGNGTSVNSNVPVAVDTSGVLNGKTVTEIDAGYDFALAGDGPVLRDTATPTLTLTQPSGSYATGIVSIEGTQFDNVGISRFFITLQRRSDDFYWNGSAWAPFSPSSKLSARLAGDQWICTSTLPQDFQLLPGTYFIAAHAFDAAGNTSSVSREFEISPRDTTAPTASITNPIANSFRTTLVSIGGTARDNAGASQSGIVDIRFSLRRQSDGKYWYDAGKQWLSDPSELTVERTGDNWICTTSLPAGSALQAGAYAASVVVVDGAYNQATAAVSFVVDKAAPTIAITTPTSNAFLKALPQISGTARDDTGVVRVDLYLQRKSDNKFWNGSAWTSSTPISTVLSGAAPKQWTRNSGFPSGANLTSGLYFVAARAYDAANNGTSATANFYVDTVAPTVSISSPAINSTVSSFASASGTTSDIGTSGVVRVEFFLRRNADSKWWNGSAWVAAGVPLATSLAPISGGQSWSISGLLPKGANLLNGSYLIGATAFDRAGNSRNVNGNFTLSRPPSEAAASNVQLSSAIAKSDGTIKLTFTGALGASAMESSNYSVTQNGATVEVQSVQQANSSEVVLSGDALTSGARIGVSYDLEDAHGRSITGTANVVVK